jgi:hypothetical protein
MRMAWIWAQGALSLTIINILFWKLAVEAALELSDATWSAPAKLLLIALLLATAVKPGQPLMLLWMRAHGYWR